jgi:hypothetical protein
MLAASFTARFSALRLACFLLLGLGFIGEARARTRVELVVDEATQSRTVAWPVTTGVPFPRGGLVDAQHCRLVDDTGAERPLQTKVAATWDAARSSIRWLTIDFIARPGRKYALEFGPDVRREPNSPQLTVAYAGDTRAANHAVVSTGAIQVDFAPRAPEVLHAVRLDLNGDGTITPQERVAFGPKEGDHTFTEAAGRVSSSARDAKDRTITVEATGPVRACIRVDGWYTDPDGRRTVAYRTRYHLFAGLGLIKVIDEFRIIGSTRDVQFKDIALPLELDLGGESRSIATAEGTFGVDAPHEVSLVQETYRHYGNPECVAKVLERSSGGERAVHTAERAGPWMQISGAQASVTGSLRNFSQQFPKEWSSKKDRLTLHLWSPRVEPLDFGQKGLERFFGEAGKKYLFDWKSGGGSSPISDFFYYAGHNALKRDGADGRGINKHHEIWYHFGRASEAAAGREYGALADKQPIALATGKWNVGTEVFGPLAARPGDHPDDAPADRFYDVYFDLQRKMQDDFGDYGWFLFGAGPHYSYQWDKDTKKHYADPRRFEYHTYQRETQYWWNYIRSGERKFYDWCFPSENHWVDIAVAHVPMTYSTEWRGGKKGDAQLNYPAGDWSIDSPLHYVRHHDTGEAWLRSASQFWGTYHRTLETTTLAYYLSGDERYNDVIAFWKDYWGPLAGVRSDSADVKEFHTDQMWWNPTAAGKPSKSWAEMVRDYAPFQSGSRHQQTLFFNLSTLYEHTWDPTVKQVLDEYAAAFIKPENPNGVWQCQDHHLPANADSPMLAHYWSPALWKYARASGDKRMPEVLKKYFTACIDADPYGCDVGIYSNNQIAWGWYFTKDPRFFAAERYERTRLSNRRSRESDKPEDVGGRIYNPYNPIFVSATMPRLNGVFQELRRLGKEQLEELPKGPSLDPQRTLIAFRLDHFRKQQTGVLWGWDPNVEIVDADGIHAEATKQVRTLRSHRQPFDHNLRSFPVFQTDFTMPADARQEWCYISPKAETGIIDLACGGHMWYWAGEPVKLEANRTFTWFRDPKLKTVTIETATPGRIQLSADSSKFHGYLPGRVEKNRFIADLAKLPDDVVRIEIQSTDREPIWLRFADMPDDACWGNTYHPSHLSVYSGNPPPTPKKLIEARRKPKLEVDGVSAAGKFGKALYVAGGSEFEIPDEVAQPDGTKRRLSDARQGSLEFWIRRLTDERTQQVPRTTIFYAGPIQVAMPQHVPLDEWTHVAVDWFPTLDDPEQVIASVYVNGVDHGNYRSIYWSGYGDRVPTFAPTKTPWLGKWKITAPAGTEYLLDDVRLSSTPRYTDVKTPFGRAQTFNPKSFDVPTKPMEFDGTALWIAPLDELVDGSFAAQTKESPIKITTVRVGKN